MGMSFAYGPTDEAESLQVLRRYLQLGGNFLDTAETVKELAKKKGCTPAQFALAWVLAQGDDVIPIRGTKRVPYLEDNMEALTVQLTKGDLQEADARFGRVPVAGERYTPDMMALVDG